MPSYFPLYEVVATQRTVEIPSILSTVLFLSLGKNPAPFGEAGFVVK